MIFINGSTGMIGRYLLSYFRSYMDLSTFGHNSKENPFSLSEPDTTELCMCLSNARYIIHTEAYAGNDNSNLHIDSINKLRNVIECMPSSCHLIYFSSCSVYKADSCGAESSDRIGGDTLYLKSKLFCEELIKSNVENYTIFRLANVISDDMRHGVIYDWSNKYYPNSTISVDRVYPYFERSFIDVALVCSVIKRHISRDVSNVGTVNICGDTISAPMLANKYTLSINRYGNKPASICSPNPNKLNEIYDIYASDASIYITRYLKSVKYYDKVKS